MTTRRGESGTQIEDVVADLRQIAEEVRERAPEADADAVRAAMGDELAFRFPDYLSFLSRVDCVDWNRRRGRIEPAEAIGLPVEASSDWRKSVADQFDLPGDVSSSGADQTGGETASASPSSGADSTPSGDTSDIGEGEDPADESAAVKTIEVEESSPEGESDAFDTTVREGEETPAVGDVQLDEQASLEGEDISRAYADDGEEGDDEDAVDVGADAPIEESESTHRQQDRPNESEEMARNSSDRDRYERNEEIGTGGLGTVYKGRHKPLDRTVAIKEISKVFDVFADLQRDEIVDRFQNITRAQAEISHPAVTQIFDLSTEGDHPFAVTEYVPNGSLRRLIDDEETRTLRVVLKYFIQLLHGLNAAHREGLVHGNIKPENVLLDASGNAKLSDFGLSTLVDLEGASDQVYVGVGAVAYMAPEQFQNPNAATQHSDIYALGILFYEMLTGKVPGRRSPMPSSFFPDVPRSLDDIFDRMTMDAEEDRFDSVAAILSEFYSDDEILELLDRRSGVVFLRDPLEFGDQPLVGEEAELQPDFSSGADTAQTDAASGDGDADPEEQPDESSEADETADSDEQEEFTEKETSSVEAPASDVEESEESGDEGGAEREESEQDGQDGADEPDVEGDEDEVLDKIDEYGEMFDQD